MKKSSTLLFFLFLGFISSLAQNYQWAKSMGGFYNDHGNSIATDGSANVYITGDFRFIVDFDPGLGTSNLTSFTGTHDIYISKLDAAGNLLWAKSIVGAGDNFSYSIAVDRAGNVYTTGNFVGTADFDPGAGTSILTSMGSSDLFISKLDSAGNFIWAKSIGGTGYEIGTSISVDAAGNVFTTGSFAGTVDFNPGVGTNNLTSSGAYDTFISKLDAAGNFVWAKTIGGNNLSYGYSITVDGGGNAYTIGTFGGTVDFDPGTGTYNLISEGGNDIFILKLDAAGNFNWAKSIGGNSHDYGKSIAVDSSNNVYTTGSFSGTVDFDPGAGTSNLTSLWSVDAFISKLDSAGNLVWAKNMGGTGYVEGLSIAVDGFGNVHTTGSFNASIDFDPGAGTSNLTSVAFTDAFISKLDASGNYIWAKSIGGNNFDKGLSIALDGAGNAYTTGYFSVSVDFDPGAGTSNLISKGDRDIFILKLGASSVGILENSFEKSIMAYPNPTKGTMSIDIGESFDDTNLIIRNQLGQEVLNNSYTGSTILKFDIPGGAGVYIIEITSNDKRAILKVVKE